MVRKTIFTVNVDDYAPEVTAITYPLIKRYADKIRADFHVITERKYPEFPPAYEKLQIFGLGPQMRNEWNIYLDSDALVHPDMVDPTVVLPRDTVMHHGHDFAPIRWRYDRFFLRDGRHIGSGNWFTIASDWCIDLWKPLDDMTLEEALDNIFPTQQERDSGLIDPAHLLDDYTLSRNIAKFGLKFISFRQLMTKYGWDNGTPFLWHHYTIPIEAKVLEMNRLLKHWGVSK